MFLFIFTPPDSIPLGFLEFFFIHVYFKAYATDNNC